MGIYRGGLWLTANNRGEIIDTPAFQYGFGLFETIRISQGRLCDVEDHLKRMLGGIATLDKEMPNPFTLAEIIEIIANAIDTRPDKDDEEVLKVIAFRKNDFWEMLLVTRPYPYISDDYIRGFSILMARHKRSFENPILRHKTLNYLDNYLERLEARRLGFDDAYFLNTDGVVTECTASNLFIETDEGFITSPVEAGLLPGIMRAKLLRSGHRIGIAVRQDKITQEILSEAKSVIVTNALMGAMPVSRVGNVVYAVDLDLVKKINDVLERSWDNLPVNRQCLKGKR